MWLLLFLAASAVTETRFTPQVPILGACTNDTQCALELVCSSDGLCIEPDVGSLPVARMSSGLIAVCVIVTGILSFFGCLVCGLYCLEVSFKPGSWEEQEENVAAGVAVFSLCFCLAAAVIMGAALGLTTITTVPLDADDTTVIPPTSQPIVPPLTAVLVAVVVACTCALICLLSSVTFTKINHDYEISVPHLAGMVACVLLVVGLVVGLPLGLVRKTETSPASPGNLSNCTHLSAPACAPYYCDVPRGLCLWRCASDNECVNDADVCSNGECILDPSSRNVPGEVEAPLELWAVVLVCVFVGVCCCLCCCAVCTVAEDEPKMDAEAAKRMIVSACCGVCVATVLGLSLGLAGASHVPPLAGNGSLCTADAVCAPYYCDGSMQQCFESCDDSINCVDGFVCDAGKCKPDDNSGIDRRTMSPEAAVGTSLGVAACLSIAIACCAAMAAKGMDEDNDPELAFLCFCVGCCVLLSVILGLSLGFSRVDVMPLEDDWSPHVNASHCVSLQAVICEPYYCDRRVSRCYEGCAHSSQCMAGTECIMPEGQKDNKELIGECVALSSRRSPRWLPGWAAYLLALSVALTLTICHICVWRKRGLTGEGEAMDKRRGAAFWGSVITFSCCLLICGLIFGLIHSGEPPANSSPVFEPLLPSWAFGLTIFTVVLLCSCGVVTIAFPFLPVDWSAPIGLLLANLADVQIQAGIMLMFSVACCSAMGLIMIGMPLGIAKVEIAPTASHPPVDVNMTTPECVSALSSSCFPFYCDVSTGACNTLCADDLDCRAGAVCFQGNCTLSATMGVLPPGWSLFVTVAVSTVVFMLAAVAASWFAGCSCSLHTMHGARLSRLPYNLRLARLPAVLCTAVCVAGLFAIYVGLPLANVESLVAPTRSGSGRECVAFDAWQCSPYHCDVRKGGCYQDCGASAECTDGYECAGGACVRLSNDDLHTATFALVGGVVLVVTVVCVLPSVRRFILGCQVQRRRRLMEKEMKDAAEREELRQKVLRDHPMVLNIEPTNPAGFDPSEVPCAHLLLEGVKIVSVSSPAARLEDVECFPAPGLEPTKKDLNSSVFSDSPLLSGPAEHTRRPSASSDGDEDAPSSTPEEETHIMEEETTTDMCETPLVPAPLIHEDCGVCLVEPATVRFVGQHCGHGFCESCAAESLVAIADNDQFPARCPGCRAGDVTADGGGVAVEALDADCDTTSLIPADTVERLVARAVISLDFGRRFIQLQILRAFRSSEVVSCPMCTMLVALPPAADTRDKKRKPWEMTRVECPECDTLFCSRCNSLFSAHGGLTCEQLAARKMGEEDRKTDRLIDETAKRCPKCSMGISHYRGHSCHHIMPGSGCPSCGYHFCIVCLRPHPCNSRDHDQFCDDRCDCPPCPTCRPGAPCSQCDGTETCPVCVPPLQPP